VRSATVVRKLPRDVFDLIGKDPSPMATDDNAKTRRGRLKTAPGVDNLSDNPRPRLRNFSPDQEFVAPLRIFPTYD